MGRMEVRGKKEKNKTSVLFRFSPGVCLKTSTRITDGQKTKVFEDPCLNRCASCSFLSRTQKKMFGKGVESAVKNTTETNVNRKSFVLGRKRLHFRHRNFLRGTGNLWRVCQRSLIRWSYFL